VQRSNLNVLVQHLIAAAAAAAELVGCLGATIRPAQRAAKVAMAKVAMAKVAMAKVAMAKVAMAKVAMAGLRSGKSLSPGDYYHFSNHRANPIRVPDRLSSSALVLRPSAPDSR
jgi:hypothetical protein